MWPCILAHEFGDAHRTDLSILPVTMSNNDSDNNLNVEFWFAAAMRQDSSCCCLLDGGCSSDLFCRLWCVGRIAEDDEALLPALILWPSTSSHLLLTPPLPAPHSKFSLCSFTIRSVGSQPACQAQCSVDATIIHSLSNSDAKSVPTVGGRRLHFKCCSIRKKKHCQPFK